MTSIVWTKFTFPNPEHKPKLDLLIHLIEFTWLPEAENAIRTAYTENNGWISYAGNLLETYLESIALAHHSLFEYHPHLHLIHVFSNWGYCLKIAEIMPDYQHTANRNLDPFLRMATSDEFIDIIRRYTHTMIQAIGLTTIRNNFIFIHNVLPMVKHFLETIDPQELQIMEVVTLNED